MRKISCIVLSAGQGTRMGDSRVHKVCCPVCGKPAILRALECYRECGLDPVVVVVGARAREVMATVASGCPEAKFAFQPRRLGTGNAVRTGYEVLKRIDRDPEVPVLITMGDKVVSPEAVERLIESYFSRGRPAMAFCTAPRSEWASGRVAKDESGRLIGIFERQDIRRALFAGRLLDLCLENRPLAAGQVKELIDEMGSGFSTSKLLPEDFVKLVHEQVELRPAVIREFFTDSDRLVPSGDRSFDPRRIESSSTHLNVSLYLIGKKNLEEGLSSLKPGNAQGEEYFTDLVNQLIFRFREEGDETRRVVDVPLADARMVMSFNNREQLRKIESLLKLEV
ncbi:MAG: NTP transferase domain-containing protein [Candidatus Glassbacteria bacterium]|nr:NTP transferase domain-containing protein [Candidatus Glassbacteria bacterium]